MAGAIETSRLAFTEIDQDVSLALRKVWPIIEKDLDGILDKFYRHIATEPEIAARLEQGPSAEMLKQAQIRFWQSLFNDAFNEDYFEHARQLGEAHAGIGLGPRWHIAALTFIQPRLFRLIARKHKRAKKAVRYCNAVAKAIAMDMYLAQDAAGSSDESRQFETGSEFGRCA